MQYHFRVSVSAISVFIPQVCKALYDALQPIFMKCPCTPEEWLVVAEDFQTIWQLKHGIGGMDGKHVAVQAPKKTGSRYYNYKKFFSVILFALVDANYRFLYVDIGRNGQNSDAGVWENCDLQAGLRSGQIPIPDPIPITPGGPDIPFYIIGDDAFPLRPGLMKPYPGSNLSKEQRITNYRFSRGRRVSENAFGILCQRFRCLRRPLLLSASNTQEVVKACCALHNFMRRGITATNREEPERQPTSKKTWVDLEQVPERETADTAKAVRDHLKHYFNGAGSIPFQDRMIGEED